MLPLPSNDADEVKDDQDVDDQSGAFQRARLADQLIEFEWNQERRRNDGQPLGPALPEEEAAAFYKFQPSVGERGGPEQRELVLSQPSQSRDDVTDEGTAWVSVPITRPFRPIGILGRRGRRDLARGSRNRDVAQSCIALADGTETVGP